MITPNNNWNYPNAIRVGAGRIDELADLLQALGIRAPLFITDPALSPLPMVQDALNHCRKRGLSSAVFDGIQSNPTGSHVEHGVVAFKNNKHDGIVGFGGGSALDTAKAVGLMAGQKRPLWDFEDIADNWTRVDTNGLAPVVAIPTTAGTGSEVSRSSVITDERARVKRIIFHPQMLPDAVILDPRLTVALPAPLTAATGMDALSHNLEAYCSPAFHPLADGIAIEGIRLVKDFLPRAVEAPDDLEARTQMLAASSMGATAFQKGLGAMHALAHPLGALYNAHHGLLNAILMPYVLAANRKALVSKMDRLARYLDLPGEGIDGVLTWILALRQQLAIPHTLAAIDIDERDADKVGDMAAADPSAGGNPIAFDAKAYKQLFINAINGRL